MPELTFSGISKTFPGGAEVIRDFTAAIPDREFLVLLGPSGCGKSTMLRMIAGLIDISSGDLRFDGSNRLGDRSPFLFRRFAATAPLTACCRLFPFGFDHRLRGFCQHGRQRNQFLRVGSGGNGQSGRRGRCRCFAA